MLVYTAVARLRGTVRVKCLDNTMSWPGIKPRLLDLPDNCTREEAIAPPTTDNVKDSKIHNYNEVIQYTWNNAPCYKLLNNCDHYRALCVVNNRGMNQILTLFI